MTASSAAEFYTRHATRYDRLATDAPLVGRLREAAVDALAVSRGAVVCEMGCGTGANLRLLRERVGREGTVLGVDVAPGVLERARDRVRDAGWHNVHVVRGDATRPPAAVDDEVDAVLATFLTGMLPEPAAAVRDWCRLVGDGGRICLVNLARTTHPVARALNPLFGALVAVAAPGGSAKARGNAAAILDERAHAAHAAVHDHCDDARTSRHLGGFARITAGTVRDR